MKVIGVSGYIGVGKSTMLDYLKQNSEFKIIDADKVAKSILHNKKIIKFLKKYIPNTLDQNHQINRSILRKTLFKNHNLNDQFSKISMPLISKEIKNIIKQEKKAKLIFVEAAMISEIKIKFNKTIFLVKNDEQRLERVFKRDNREIEEIHSITEFQRKKMKNYKFDYIINNNNDKKNFYKNIDDLVNSFL